MSGVLMSEVRTRARRRMFGVDIVELWPDALPLLPVATVVALAAFEGGYFPREWSWGALALFWVAALALLVGSPAQPSGLELALLGAVAAFVVWVAFSIAWSPAPAGTVSEVERDLLYVGGVLALILTVRRRSAPLLLVATLCAITGVCVYSLLTRLFPEQLGTYNPIALYRLSTPLGYWNALGIFAVIGALLALGFAAHARAAAGRALAGGALVILLPTVYFTFGRGPWIGLAAGLIAAIALDPRRVRLITTGIVLSPAVGLAVFIGGRSSALTRQSAPLAEASRDGHRYALVLVLLVLLAVGLLLVMTYVEQTATFDARVRTAYRAALVGAAVISLIVVFAAYGSPSTIASKAYRSFKAPPVSVRSGTSLNKRLFSFSGNGRTDLWSAAWKDYKAHPEVGSGAGSYEEYWTQHRSATFAVRDAHNLYIEVLAELGPIGLILLIAAFGVPLIAAIRARAHPLVPGAFGAYVAYLVHAGGDWDWEVTALTLAALVVAVALLVLARREEQTLESPPVRFTALGVMLPVMAFIGLGLLGNVALRTSVDAANAGNWKTAESEARSAKRWAPWSPDPWRWLAEAQRARGDLAGARVNLRKAISKDTKNWIFWYELAVVSKGRAQRDAIARAAALNPRDAGVAALRAKVAKAGK
jgi:hypothetical protein